MDDRRLVALIALVALAACSRAETPPAEEPVEATVTATPANDATVPATASDLDRAVAVALALEANAEATDSILTAHALTIDGLETLMLRIASDSAMSEAYVRRTSGRGS